MRHRAGHGRQHLVQVKGLGQVIKHTFLEGFDGLVKVGKPGHRDHRDLALLLAQGIKHREPIGIGQADIGEDDVR